MYTSDNNVIPLSFLFLNNHLRHKCVFTFLICSPKSTPVEICSSTSDCNNKIPFSFYSLRISVINSTLNLTVNTYHEIKLVNDKML